MKNLITLFITGSFLSLSVYASPLEGLRNELNSSLQATESKMDILALKKMADERNTDMDVAFENYLIAKKRVAVARAAFNPITTGHVLGIALGMTYLWAPIAVEAVTSIPMKLYNVSSNKYLAKAALFNSYEARSAINNELAHLYYDVLTHEVLLKSVDKEIAILMFQQDLLEKTAPTARKATIDYDKAQILALKMERVDLYNLLKEEEAALKTLLTLNPEVALEFKHNSQSLKKSFLDNLDQQKLQDFALVNSNKFKTNINIHHAAEANVKSVQWSILSFSGLNFSWKSRVRVAKIDEGVAELNKVSSEKTIKTDVLIQKEKLESALNVVENYSELSDSSMQLFEDNLQLYQSGVKPQDYAFETSLGAIRDFRSKIIAHYASWSALDDFSKAASFNFSFKNENDNAQKQIEANSMYDISESDFKVIQDGSFDNVSLKIASDRLNVVEKVEYRFSNRSYGTISSSSEKRKFEATLSNNNGPIGDLSGIALIVFKNGHELSVKF